MNEIQESFGRRLLNLLLWGETRFFEFCIGLQLLARLAYGQILHGYPIFMIIFGAIIGAYVVYASVSRGVAHRHKATSLLMVFYVAYVYTASTKLDFPITKTGYYIFNMVIPALYLKWRTYREFMHREQQSS